MGYYVKDAVDLAKDKSAVEKQKAKIKKFGKCEKHNGHWDGDWWFGGFLTAIWPAVFIIVVMSSHLDSVKSDLQGWKNCYQNAENVVQQYAQANVQWQNAYNALYRKYDELSKKPVKKPKGIAFNCTGKDGKLMQGIGKDEVTIPESDVSLIKECKFTIQY